ncbi:hypothetical protein GCM10010104_25680 [Streptomyces indiaensis]|uniref:Uncharacterized protein n=1 Tax=Streptomyces indiaensis TaxID=284033 RepID=A0ABP5QBP1_9ACTN
MAKRQAVTNVERAAHSVKRHMGDHGRRFPEYGDVDGKRYTAQEINQGGREDRGPERS